MVAAVPQNIPKDFLSSSGRQPKLREQAAAVCYRAGVHGIEFLLVKTGGGRWTFPKGSIEPGMSYAQSAALEAYEEAGVHGRIEVAAFARYVRRGSAKSCSESTLVFAFLCEVQRLAKPQERGRNRTWFPAEKAKRRLQEGRPVGSGEELAAVVDRAVARVERLSNYSDARKSAKDGLQKVCFEASARAGIPKTAGANAGYFRGGPAVARAIPSSLEAPAQKLLPAATERPLLRLGSGSKASAGTVVKVTMIDTMREKTARKSG